MKSKIISNTINSSQFIAALFVSSMLITSCVSTKKYNETKENYARLNEKYHDLQSRYNRCEDSSTSLVARMRVMDGQVADLKENNNEILGRLKDLSVISGAQAESIKKSLDNIGVKDAYIKDLQTAVSRRDSLNMALIINLKGALGDINDKDVTIKVEKGVVYVDISDKLLFNSGKYNVTPKAQEVLGKVARVLEAQPQIEFIVEGHTDTVPFSQGVLQDNWDLSVKRATAVVRILQNKYHISPTRMSAAGRGEYIPVASNDTDSGRAENRRTRIVIIPQLDQFFKLLEKPKQQI